MAYCTPTQVHALDQGRPAFSGSSKPTLTEVTEFIARADSMLDAWLAAAGYVTPVPASASRSRVLVEHWSAVGANCMVQRAAQNSDREERDCAAWAEAEKLISIMEMPDLDSDTTGNGPYYIESAPAFEMDVPQFYGSTTRSTPDY